ncbi:chemotaxis protein CheW [Methylobacterium persicinum]
MRDATPGDPTRDREIKAARTLALARRKDAAAEAVRPTHPYLVCACGGDRIGLPLGAVAQVLPGRPCTPVPGSGPALSGIVALSGRIVPVIGLARALGRPAAEGADPRITSFCCAASRRSPSRSIAPSPSCDPPTSGTHPRPARRPPHWEAAPLRTMSPAPTAARTSPSSTRRRCCGG